MTKAQVIAICDEITGGLSKTTKMPEASNAIPAKNCKVGTTLRGIKGSVCHKCYAFERGNYQWEVVKNAQERRYKKLYHPLWVRAMTMLLWLKVKAYFRWHDSGDIDSIKHLCNIIEVCVNTPHIKHWLPTKEKRLVREFLNRGGVIPANLVISMSGYFVDGGTVKGFDNEPQITHHLTYSKRNRDGAVSKGYVCPVEDDLGFKSCDKANCFSCWDATVPVVVGGLH